MFVCLFFHLGPPSDKEACRADAHWGLPGGETPVPDQQEVSRGLQARQSVGGCPDLALRALLILRGEKRTQSFESVI